MPRRFSLFRPRTSSVPRPETPIEKLTSLTPSPPSSPPQKENHYDTMSSPPKVSALPPQLPPIRRDGVDAQKFMVEVEQKLVRLSDKRLVEQRVSLSDHQITKIGIAPIRGCLERAIDRRYSNQDAEMPRPRAASKAKRAPNITEEPSSTSH